MTESEVRQAAKGLLKEGKGHQDVFQLLSKDFPKSKLVEIIRYMPSNKAVNKYDFINWIVVMLLLSTLAIVFLSTGMIPILVWSGLALTVVLKRWYKYYLWVSGLCFFYVFGFILIMLFKSGESINILSLITLGLNILVIVLLSYLNMKILPSVKQKKERVRRNGVVRVVQRIEFE
ncbi:hypothetical protein [Croceimicrobium sp.]|uniref:hypothetical protein n=1 Tax=Croceimicrobium sp. TaxID=2828340 RepID=UPI003BA8A468